MKVEFTLQCCVVVVMMAATPCTASWVQIVQLKNTREASRSFWNDLRSCSVLLMAPIGNDVTRKMAAEVSGTSVKHLDWASAAE